jgi:hypothetical protein
MAVMEFFSTRWADWADWFDSGGGPRALQLSRTGKVNIKGALRSEM